MRASLIFPIAVSGLLLASATVRADSPPPPPAPAQPAAATSDGDKMVCRTLAAKTGSRLGARRECRTQREWDDILHQQQDETSKMQSRGLTSGVPGQ
jgi:hypothetical protein